MKKQVAHWLGWVEARATCKPLGLCQLMFCKDCCRVFCACFLKKCCCHAPESKNLKCTSSNWKNKNMFFSLNQLRGGREDQKSKKNKYFLKTNIIFKTYFTKQKGQREDGREKKYRSNKKIVLYSLKKV